MLKVFVLGAFFTVLSMGLSLPVYAQAADDHDHRSASSPFPVMGNLMTVTKDGRTRALTNDEVREIVSYKLKDHYKNSSYMVKGGLPAGLRVAKDTVTFDLVDLMNNPVRTITISRKDGIPADEAAIYTAMAAEDAAIAKRAAYRNEQLKRQTKVIEDLDKQQKLQPKNTAPKNVTPKATQAPTVRKQTTTSPAKKTTTPAKK